MFDLIFNKCDSYFSVRKKSARGAPQENDANQLGEHLKKMTPISDLQLLHKESGNSMTTVK